MRPDPDVVVLQWMAAQTDALYVTALSYTEILFGIDLLPKGRRRQRLGEQAAAMRRHCGRRSGQRAHWPNVTG